MGRRIRRTGSARQQTLTQPSAKPNSRQTARMPSPRSPRARAESTVAACIEPGAAGSPETRTTQFIAAGLRAALGHAAKLFARASLDKHLWARACLALPCAAICQAQASNQPPPTGDPAATRSVERLAPQLAGPAGTLPLIDDASRATAPGIPLTSPGLLERGSVSFENGIRFSFPATSGKAHIGALIQQDWVFFEEDAALRAAPGIGDLQDATFFRRARVKFDGTTHDFIEWDFDAELLSNANVAFDDLWIGFKSIPRIGNLRIGHIKLPQGLESITSNRVFTFLERSAQHDAFYREYGPGLMIFDNWGGDRGQWSLSVHRQDTAGDGVAVGDGEYAVTGRLTDVPYSAHKDEQLLHLGVSASYRAAALDPAESQRFVRFRARPEFRIARQTPVFVDTGQIVADSSLVLGSEAALIYGPLSVQAEYTAASVLGREADTPGAAADDPWFHGGFVQLSYFVTGEHRPYDRRLARMGTLSPTRSVGPNHRLAGAWEFATRYTWLDLNDGDVRGGELDAWTAGVNWYWSAFFRMQLNYVLTDRDAPDGEGRASGFLMRFSLNL